MSLIPTLRSGRLVLRPMRIEDYPKYRAMMASLRSAYMGGPFEERGTWGMFCHDAGCWALFGHGGLMVDLAATGETVGQVGINAGPLFPEPELGWMLYDGFEGQGYATEAATALRDWAFETLEFASLVSYIDPANAGSIAVAERLGGVRDDNAPRQDSDDIVYRHFPQR